MQRRCTCRGEAAEKEAGERHPSWGKRSSGDGGAGSHEKDEAGGGGGDEDGDGDMERERGTVRGVDVARSELFTFYPLHL